MVDQSSQQDLGTYLPTPEILDNGGKRSWGKRMKRKYVRFSHYVIKGVLYLMWAAIAVQAAVYFLNPARVKYYTIVVDYWKGIWEVFFS